MMPRFCHNVLFVEGDLETLVQLKEKAEGVDFMNAGIYNEFNFYKFLPVPRELWKDKKAILNWQLKNWGCKEGVLRASVTPRFEHKALDYAILTNGNPPVKALEEISKQYPSLKFDLVFKIPSKGANGELTFKEGFRK